MTRRIALMTPGPKEHAERFYTQAIDPLGFDSQVDPVFYINAKWDATGYPDELLEEKHPYQIAREQYEFTRVRLDDFYQRKPWDSVVLNYEPEDPDSDNHFASWLWSCMVEGYGPADQTVLDMMRRGVELATDGLPFWIYRTPALPKQPMPTGSYTQLRETMQMVAPQQDRLWLHCYPQTIDDKHDIDQLWNQIATHVDLLSQFDKPIVPVLWPSFKLSEDGARVYGEVMGRVLSVLSRDRLDFDQVGIWVDCSNPATTAQQVRNMHAIAASVGRLLLG